MAQAEERDRGASLSGRYADVGYLCAGFGSRLSDDRLVLIVQNHVSLAPIRIQI